MSSQTPAPDSTSGPAGEDLGPLAWVLGEIQKTLDAVGKTLRRFAREVGPASAHDLTPLRLVRQQLHQAVGALQMVGHPAPALVLGAMEFAVQSFAEEPARCTEAAAQKLERAGFAVADFLQAMLAGKSVSSVALFPQYRDVLEIVGNERVHPADLWSRTWRWAEIRPAPTQSALVYDPAVRSKLDREVLSVVKSGDEQAARRLRALCLGLARGAQVPRATSFWMLAAGFFEALSLALVPIDPYVKRAASRVLLQYSTLARGDNTVSDRLGQDLLFFCAQAVPGPQDDAPILREVRNAWSIGDDRPVDYTVEQFGRFDPQALAQARKRIETAKEMWSALSGGDVSRIRQVADAFAQLGESLQKLHPASAPLVQSLAASVDTSMRSGRPPATELAMEVATAVLYLEAAFEDLDPQDRQLTARTVQLAGRIDRVREGGRSEPLEPWMEDLYRRVSDRHTMGTVVDELRSHLAELEKSLDQFFRRPTDQSVLRAVPTQLLQMRGVFSVLGLDQAAQTVSSMRDGVEQLLLDGVDGSAGRFDSLGNNLGALGFLIDMLSYQPALAKRLFVYDAQAGELKPLMGRQSPDEVAMGDAAGTPEAASPGAAPSVLSVDEVDAQIAAKLAELAGSKRKGPAAAIEEFARDAATWKAKITGPAPLEALPDTEVTELEEDDLLNIFLDEAREVLHNGLAAVSALGDEPGNVGELTVLRRAFHTLKGSSRMVGLTEFGDAAWSLEQVLNTWLADQRPATPELLQGARNALQDFAKWVEDIAGGNAQGWKAAPFKSLAEALSAGESLPVPRTSSVDALVAAARHIAGQTAAPQVIEAKAAELPLLPDLDFGIAAPSAQDTSAPDTAENAESESERDELVDAEADQAVVATPDDDFVSTDFLDFDHGRSPAESEAAASLGELEDIDFLETAQAPIAEPLRPAAPANAGQAAQELDFRIRLAPTHDEVVPGESQAQHADTSEPIDAGEDSAAPTAPWTGPQDVEVAASPAKPDHADDLPAIAIESADIPQAAETPRQDPETVEAERPGESVEVARSAPVADPAEQPAETSDMDGLGGHEEQVKVIGPLRIGIPLYNVYLVEADEWSRQLLAEVGEWALEPHRRVADSTVALAHSLAGSSATVGFQGLSAMARLFEAALQHLQTEPAGTAEHGETLVAAAEEIRRLLHQFAAGFLKEPSGYLMDGLRGIAWSQAAGSDEASAEPAAPASARAGSGDVALDDTGDAFDVEDAVDAELFPVFEEEAAELLPQLGTALRQWAAHPADAAPRSAALRTLHTLKGSARLAGAMRMGERAHRMEAEVEAIGAGTVDPQGIELLVARFDALQGAFDELRAADRATQAEIAERAASAGAASETPAPAPASEPAPADASVVPAGASGEGAPLPAPESAAPAAPAPAETRGKPRIAPPTPLAVAPTRAGSGQAVRIRTHLLDRLVAQAGEVMITRSRLEAELGQLRSSLSDLTGNLDRLRQQLRDIEVQAESQMQSRLAQAKDSQQGFDPLEFDRFTRVQELTRMMAESVNDVATVQRTLQRTVQSTEDDLSAQARQTRELQRGLLRTRMVEFEGISERLYRVARQASKDSGKQVRVEITGGTIEMDRGVLDRMTPAFEHLLRNAVAHGIEDAAGREQAGKDPVGWIGIELHHEGNDVSVSFRDDGAGLDQARITERARQLGLWSHSRLPAADELAELIFTPGFSTAEEVSELSGRGIGMDVVRAQVAALGGRTEVATEPGRGTSFKLVLPLTTAVTHVVMVRAGDSAFGIPSNLIELVQRASASDLESAYMHQAYAYGGEQVPFYWAGALLQQSSRSERAPGRANTLVVVRSAAQRVALHVDEVLGNQEVVVKNLGPQLSRVPGMAAISVLASGAVALIYNPVALAAVHGQEAARFQRSARPAQDAASRPDVPVAASVPPQIPLVLVVDDSITVRRVTQRLLQREGYRVALAADGLQALERLQQERPAVVLSDIEMPRMDGFDLARNIRADASLVGLPIIMITSRIAEKHRDHARALGVNHYLGKPYSEDELLRLVRSFTQLEALAA